MAVRYSNPKLGGHIRLEVDDVSSIKHLPHEEEKQNELQKISLSLRVLKRFPHLPAVLLMVYSVPMTALFALIAVAVNIPFSDNPCAKSPEFSEKTVILSTATLLIQNVLIFLAFPISGWLADTKFGRYRIIYASMWCQWLGMILLVLSALLSLYPDPCSGFLYYIGKYIFSILSLVCFSLSVSGFFPNILAFTMDQLEAASSSSLSRYVRWFTWSIFVGLLLGNILAVINFFQPDAVNDNLPVISVVLLGAFSLPAIALSFTDSLYTKPLPNKKIINPYGVLFGVVLFAYKHKIPVKRSAMTYWEEDLPKRVDLAKDKYGGPYTTENVEDVKTFLRILLLMLALCVYYVPYAGPVFEGIPFVNHLMQLSSSSQYKQWFLPSIAALVPIIGIPILELIILPLYPKFEYFSFKPLRWILLGMVMMFFSNFSYLLIDVLAHYFEGNDACFLQFVVTNSTESIPFQWVVIPTFFWGLSDLLVGPSIFCFLCCQAPYNMRGMILGLFLLLQRGSVFSGIVIAIIFTVAKFNFPVSCGFWYWLTLTILSGVAVVVFALAVKSYKLREREEVVNYQGIIESIYERELQLKAKKNKSRKSKSMSLN